MTRMRSECAPGWLGMRSLRGAPTISGPAALSRTGSRLGQTVNEQRSERCQGQKATTIFLGRNILIMEESCSGMRQEASQAVQVALEAHLSEQLRRCHRARSCYDHPFSTVGLCAFLRSALPWLVWHELAQHPPERLGEEEEDW